MNERTLSISEAQEQLMDIADRFEQEPEVIIVTQNDEPVMAILPFGFKETLVEKIKALHAELPLLKAQDTFKRKTLLLEEFDEE